MVDDGGGGDVEVVDDDNDLETLNGRQADPGRCVKLWTLHT